MKSIWQTLQLLSLGILTACATNPFPYHDGAFDDKNRAPTSITNDLNTRFNLGSESELSHRFKADFLFLKGDLFALEGKPDLAIENFKEAHYYDPNSSTIAYRIAVEYFRKNRVTDSLYWGLKAQERDPKNKDINLFLGGLYTSQKDYVKAEETYQTAMNQNPKMTEPVLYLAALYSEQKKYKLATELFTRLIKFEDNDQKYLAYYYRGRIAYESGQSQWEKAKKDLNKSLELKPELLEALQILGRMLEKKSGRQAAFNFYIKYQKQNGPFPRLAETLAQYFIENGDFENAFEQLEVVEKISDDDIGVKLKLALILIDRKEYSKALVKLEKLNILVPESDKVRFYMAAVNEELKHFPAAIEQYLSIPQTSSHFEDANINASLILKKTQQSGRAIQILDDLIAKKATKAQSFLTLAQVYEEQANWPKALETLHLAEAKFPTNNQINYYLGMIYDRSQNRSKMIEYMKKTIATEANHSQALNYLAYSYAERNENLNEAKEFAYRAYKLASDDGYIIDTLAWIYFKQGEYVKAADLLEKAFDFLPDVSIISEHLGDVYIKLKKFDKAADLFKQALKNETDNIRKKTIEEKIAQSEQSVSPRRPASLINEEKKDETN